MSTEIPQRIGLIGGTFDPIHNGHLFIAEEAREQFDLERVLFIVNNTPALDKGREPTPPECRLAMVELAIASNPRFECSRLEIDRPGPSYAIDTVRAVRAIYPEPTEIYFITGADTVSQLPAWRAYRELLLECRMLTVTRAGSDPETLLSSAEPIIQDNVRVLKTAVLEISSTDIRNRISEGRSARYLMPDTVIDYIREHALYE